MPPQCPIPHSKEACGCLVLQPKPIMHDPSCRPSLTANGRRRDTLRRERPQYALLWVVRLLHAHRVTHVMLGSSRAPRCRHSSPSLLDALPYHSAHPGPLYHHTRYHHNESTPRNRMGGGLRAHPQRGCLGGFCLLFGCGLVAIGCYAGCNTDVLHNAQVRCPFLLRSPLTLVLQFRRPY